MSLFCLSCSRPESETPLIALRYAGSEAWICSQCLPTLIHAPQKLAGKLANAEQIKPAPHHSHDHKH
ncbi:MAG: hypothetical protein MUF82_01545 [Bacteroidetes bacterium]|jgi:hypothetical protein|nr:hypothetical protein [Bacteroidota bacterium]